MNINQRLEIIKTEDDLEQQISLAKSYAKTLRTKAKNAPSLDEKLAIYEKLKLADITLRKIRRLAFDVEDALREGKSALSVIAA
jgi:hypothetical protein